MRIISEPEFKEALLNIMQNIDVKCLGSVVGPGRSGALAAVYASHILGIPFIPYKCNCPVKLGRLLIIDTARQTGETLRKAAKFYKNTNPLIIAVFEEPPRVVFWYEAKTPQRFKHEKPLKI